MMRVETVRNVAPAKKRESCFRDRRDVRWSHVESRRSGGDVEGEEGGGGESVMFSREEDRCRKAILSSYANSRVESGRDRLSTRSLKLEVRPQEFSGSDQCFSDSVLDLRFLHASSNPTSVFISALPDCRSFPQRDLCHDICITLHCYVAVFNERTMYIIFRMRLPLRHPRRSCHQYILKHGPSP